MYACRPQSQANIVCNRHGSQLQDGVHMLPFWFSLQRPLGCLPACNNNVRLLSEDQTSEEADTVILPSPEPNLHNFTITIENTSI